MTVIGGFMPIPLAMMIPFMATQSMVMGDAFGRAFQYGKRKISAMSNEEFNKTTIEQQASEMYASYKNIIPSLTTSIQDSQKLQEVIIREMLLILPRFATSQALWEPEKFTVGGASSIQEFFENLLKVPEAHASSTQTENEPAVLDTTLFNLSEAELSGSELATSQNQLEFNKRKAEAEAEAIEKARKAIPSEKVLSASQDPVYLAWISKLGHLKATFVTQLNLYHRKKDISFAPARSALAKAKTAASNIRKMSNDYRHPNNHIRENALRLRREIARGDFKSP